MSAADAAGRDVDTLWDLLNSHTRVSPDAIAIIGKDRAPLTYRGLLDHLNATAAGLRALGLRRHDRVAIVLPNGPEMATCFLAVASVATSAPLNPGYSIEDFRFYLEDLCARALVTSQSAPPAPAQAADSLGLPVIRLVSDPNSNAGVFELAGAVPDEGALELAQPDDIALVLHTSGTTSKPKRVPLTQRNLVASAFNIARSLQLTPDDRCLNIMPLFHVHGLMAALLGSLSVGGSVFCSPGFDATEFFCWLQQSAPTWYTAVPTMHQSLLARLSVEKPGLHRLRFVRSCSSALPPTLMNELEQAFGVPVIEAYGMTEASHQMTSNPLPPQRRKPGSVGIAGRTEVAIMDEIGNLQANNTTGEVVIRGPNVTQGYESNAEANQYSFTHGWFRTGDQGHLDADGYLFLTGRIKEIINRGGEKISPREIDEALLDHPAVVQAVAFARPHPTLGEDVAAAVVLRANSTVSEQDIRLFVLERLSPFKVPSTILVLDHIPKGPTGKMQRIGMAKRLASHFAVQHLPARDDIEALVTDIWQEILGVDLVGIWDNFFVLGGDSLRGTRAMARINELFEVNLPVTSIFRYPNVELLTREICRVANPARLNEIRAMRREIAQLSEEEAQRLLKEESGQV